MKITIEDVPATYFRWLNDLYDRLTVIAREAERGRKISLELDRCMSSRKEEGKSEPEA